jgi:hypothetical protein
MRYTGAKNVSTVKDGMYYQYSALAIAYLGISKFPWTK